uniref:Putative LOC100900174 [Metaseiulus occidentalis] n=1 Tax=Lepeophtheirus salmonis TaxID=72036 RepID=A0A0K2TK47_LEPSM
MMNNGMYVVETGGGPDILQQALREVSSQDEPQVIRRPLLPNNREEPNIQLFHALQPLQFTNHRVVYKVIYPEDVDLAPSTHGRRYPRKRGRPRRGEEVPKKPELRAKKLKDQFGLTQAQIQGLNIFDDDESEDPSNGPETEEKEEAHILVKKRTRSGRVSKPPLHHASKKSFKTIPEPLPAPPSVKKQGPPSPQPPPPPPIPQMDKPKRQLNIPPKYRCRVCNKIYLGNRKMLKHIKLFPNHGPCEEPPKASSNNLHVPIIPMARNQLEDLVKYLDAELVLDVVSKKMFDNFSLWELVAKKMSSSGRKGIPLVDTFLSEIESFLVQIKKLFDHCFTATKLGEKKTALTVNGELIQAALNVSEGPWYLEEPDHIPSEFHRILGYSKRRRNGQGIFVSPQSSDSLDDTNSNLSTVEKDSCSSMSSHSLGAQMVLETNLGAVHDENASLNSPKKRSRLDSLEEEEDEDIKGLEEEEDEDIKGLEEEDEDEEDEEEDVILDEEEDEVDPKKVLEQNGIIISSNSNDEAPLSDSHHHLDNKVINVSTSELALEIESLGPFPPPLPPPPPPSTTSKMSEVVVPTSTCEKLPAPSRLPSFSSIIAEKSSEDLLVLATTLESSSPSTNNSKSQASNVSDAVEEILQSNHSRASVPLHQPLSVIDCHGDQLSDAKLSTSTNVTFNNQQPIFSLSPSSKPQQGGGASVSSATNNSNSNHFLTDLSNVLLANETDTNDFGFPGSALSACNNSLKTPEKLLHSIPPASMMKKKDNLEGTRTNFLGALSSSTPSSSVPSSSSTLSSTCASNPPPPYEAPPLITSALADVTQTASMRVVDEGDHGHPTRDSLSSLFDEVHDVSENIFHPPPN